MGKVTLKGIDRDHLVTPQHSAGRGPVLRSDKTEIARIFFPQGEGSRRHGHPEEQTVFVESGRVEVRLGPDGDDESYVVERGQASFHPADVPHELTALEDTWVVSFKNMTGESSYEGTGSLQ